MGFEAPPLKQSILCPAGTFAARCRMVIDLGRHKKTFQGKETGEEVDKLMIGFEFPTKTHTFDDKKGPEPFTLSARYNKTFNREKGKLLPMLDSWRGEPLSKEMLIAFRFDKLIGKEATVTVMHETKPDNSKRAVISNITQLAEGMVCPPPVLPPLLYSVDMGREHPTFALLPEWIQEICNECLNWAPATPSEQSAAHGEPGANAEESSNTW